MSYQSKGNNYGIYKQINFLPKLFTKARLFSSSQQLRKKQTDDSPLSDTDLYCYSSHLEALKEDLVIRFKDLKELKIPEWVVNPFLADANNADPILFEEHIDLQNDFESKVLFQQTGYEAFWPKQQDRYPHLWKKPNYYCWHFLHHTW